MQVLRLFLLLALWALAACGSTQPVGSVNVMVLGDDSDPATVSRSHNIYQRVSAALVNQLHFAGYDTWSEQAAANFGQDPGRRGETEVLEIARLVDSPPIDVAVLLSVYALSDPTVMNTRISARLTGKLVSVPDGRNLGTLEVASPETWAVPADCASDCLMEEIGDRAQILGQSLGEMLVTLLNDQAGGGGPARPIQANVLARNFELVFQGFNAADTRLIEEYLVAFSGYQNHRIVYAAPLHTEYAYMTTDETGELVRKFDTMLERIGTDGTVTAAGNKFTVVSIPTQGQRRINTEGL